MKGIIWKEMIGKIIFVKLKSGFQYSGYITEIIDTGDGFEWLHLLDKYGKLVVFLPNEVIELREK